MKLWLKSLGVIIAALSPCLVSADPVDINAANADQLAQAMVGVGKTKADAIVQDREKNGAFRSIDDLARVKGVKQNLINKNRDKIAVTPITSTPPAEVASK